MGYTSGHPCMFSLDMKQTPETVRKVLDIAGWTVAEAAEEINVTYGNLLEVTNGVLALTPAAWNRLLDKAGSRAFDYDSESA